MVQPWGAGQVLAVGELDGYEDVKQDEFEIQTAVPLDAHVAPWAREEGRRGHASEVRPAMSPDRSKGRQNGINVRGLK